MAGIKTEYKFWSGTLKSMTLLPAVFSPMRRVIRDWDGGCGNPGCLGNRLPQRAQQLLLWSSHGNERSGERDATLALNWRNERERENIACTWKDALYALTFLSYYVLSIFSVISTVVLQLVIFNLLFHLLLYEHCRSVYGHYIWEWLSGTHTHTHSFWEGCDAWTHFCGVHKAVN